MNQMRLWAMNQPKTRVLLQSYRVARRSLLSSVCANLIFSVAFSGQIMILFYSVVTKFAVSYFQSLTETRIKMISAKLRSEISSGGV